MTEIAATSAPGQGRDDAVAPAGAASELQRYALRLRFLRQMSQTLRTLQSLDAIAPAALRHVTELTGCPWASLSCIDQLAETTSVMAAVGAGLALLEEGAEIPLAASGFDLELLGRGEVQHGTSFAELPDLPLRLRVLRATGIRAYLSVPLLVQSSLAGVITVGSAQPGRFPAEVVEVVLEVASAIESAFLQLHTARQDYAAGLEQRVRQRTVQLEHVVRELESFAYSVSHDLRSPLRAIDGFARILARDYAEALPEQARHYVERIRWNARQMEVLIDDLLAFSRLDRQGLEPQPLQMGALVWQALEVLAPERAGREVAIRVGELPACAGDATLIRQVWVNLLSNALKYSRRRAVATIEVGGNEQGGERIYFIRDNGAGFDMRYADKLFKLFQRLHRATEYEGAGVGLAHVQRIIHRHGGRVWAHAAPNEGATFFFSL